MLKLQCRITYILECLSSVWQKLLHIKYSGPSSYDRLDTRTTRVTTKILVLTYDQILSYDPHAGQGHLSYDPHGVRKLQSEPQIRMFVDVIPISAVLYIINFANCYQNGPPKS
jgi:hypothetical protein